jgi:hypothetical protein
MVFNNVETADHRDMRVVTEAREHLVAKAEKARIGQDVILDEGASTTTWKNSVTSLNPLNSTDFALVSGGKRHTLKGDKPMIDKLAGHYVAIHGKVSSTTITVFTMTAK